LKEKAHSDLKPYVAAQILGLRVGFPDPIPQAGCGRGGPRRLSAAGMLGTRPLPVA